LCTVIPMDRLIEFLFEKLILFLLKLIGSILLLTILLQIFVRFIMVHPFSWTEELSRFSFIWFCFLGSAYALKKNLHLGIDYFYKKAAPATRRKMDMFIHLIILFFGFLLCYYGTIMTQISSFQKSPILRLQMSYMYMVLPITGSFFLLFSGYRLYQIIRKK